VALKKITLIRRRTFSTESALTGPIRSRLARRLSGAKRNCYKQS
jgi:hypothetical protein